MKRKKRQIIPTGTGYHPAGKPIDCYNEIADPNRPTSPLIEYAEPRIDAATFAWWRSQDPAEADEWLRLNGPTAVGQPAE